jgi:SAM-dependent methyltransferase
MWNEDAPNWVEGGRRKWASPAPLWGAWDVPEAELGVLPDVRGLDVIDLGCGTGYWCAWFARLGARPVGLDLSEAQLETARAFQREHTIEFRLVHASAESAPFPHGLLRPDLLRIRRRHLVRSVRMDPRGPPAPTPRRAADLPV